MTHSSAPAAALSDLNIVQEVLALLADIRNLAQPLASAAGLQQALTSLLQLVNLLGVSAAWTSRLQSILADPSVFNVVLLIVQKLLGSDDPSGTTSPSPSPAPSQTPMVVLDEQTLGEWLPLVSEIIGLIRQIRGAQ